MMKIICASVRMTWADCPPLAGRGGRYLQTFLKSKIPATFGEYNRKRACNHSKTRLISGFVIVSSAAFGVIFLNRPKHKPNPVFLKDKNPV